MLHRTELHPLDELRGGPLRRALLLTVTPLLDQVAPQLFRHLQLDAAREAELVEASQRGPLVYVLRSASLVDYLALRHLVARVGLPPIGFASEVPPAIAGTPRATSPAAALERALGSGDSAVLFLKRSPSLVSIPRLKPAEGDDHLATVLSLQARMAREVFLVPLTFIWTLRPERRGWSLVDAVFGPTDMPGDLRAAAQFLLNYKHGVLRVAERLSVREFLASDEAHGTSGDDAQARYAQVRRLTYALLRRVERERRAIVGPARKPPDRVREEVLRSPKLKQIMNDMVLHGGADADELAARARAMLTELSAAPSPDLIDAIDPVADALVRQVYTSVDVDEEGIERVREAAKRGGIVLLPSHKSHVDYLVLSYVLRKHLLELPLVASGDNLAFFPVGELLRRGGAFFIRRSFKGDKLYAAVVDAYVRKLIRDGWAIEFFLEGGRSRTGKLLPPQVGLLNLVVDAALAQEEKPLAFVPISIVYERTMEDLELVREKAGAPKTRESARSLVAVGEALREKYGRVNVQFGAVVDLSSFRAEVGLERSPLTPAKRRALVNKLAHRVMSEINRATAVTAGALVATALLDMQGRGLAHADLVDRCRKLLVSALRAGARPASGLVSRSGDETRVTLRESAIREAALVFVRGGLLRQHVPDDTLTRAPRRRDELRIGADVVYTVPDEARSRLDLAKNGVVHFFVDRSLVSVSFLSERARRVTRARLVEVASRLAKLFDDEFMFRSDLGSERILEATLASMVATGELVESAEGISAGPGDGDLDGASWIALHAAHLDSFLESYRITARTLRVLLLGPLAQKDFVARALKVGEQMFLGGEIDRREALSRPTVENAISAFADLGYVRRGGDRVELSDETKSEDEVRAIEAFIATFLGRRARGGA